MLPRRIPPPERRGQEKKAVLSRLSRPRKGQDGGDLFLYNVETGVEQQFTTDPALDHWPTWRNDGAVIAFNSQRAGGNNLYVKAADGSGSTEALTSNPINQTPYDLSADGETLVITEFDPDTNWDWDIATLQIGDGSPPEKLLQTDYLDGKPAISPNRRWMAYTSDESGGRYVYVRPFPDVSSSDGQLITTDGDMPRWGPDKERAMNTWQWWLLFVVPGTLFTALSLLLFALGNHAPQRRHAMQLGVAVTFLSVATIISIGSVVGSLWLYPLGY